MVLIGYARNSAPRFGRFWRPLSGFQPINPPHYNRKDEADLLFCIFVCVSRVSQCISGLHICRSSLVLCASEFAENAGLFERKDSEKLWSRCSLECVPTCRIGRYASFLSPVPGYVPRRRLTMAGSVLRKAANDMHRNCKYPSRF